MAPPVRMAMSPTVSNKVTAAGFVQVQPSKHLESAAVGLAGIPWGQR